MNESGKKAISVRGIVPSVAIGIVAGESVAALVYQLGYSAAIPVLIGILVGTGASLLAFRLFNPKPKEQDQGIPEGAAYVCTEGVASVICEELVGSLMLIAVGTYGLNQVCRLLVALSLCGLADLVGSILVIENDTQQRVRFHARVPEVFWERLVYGYTEAFSGGMANKPISWVLEHVDLWGAPIERAAEVAIELHMRRNTNRQPSLVLLFTSPGGQGPLGVLVMQVLHDRSAESLVVGFTAMPRHGRLRERYKELKSQYQSHGVAGWVVTDNLGSDPVTADYGMVAMIVGLCDAALHADQATQPNNVLALALTEAPGAVLVYQVVADRVAAYPLVTRADRPLRYWVLKQPVVEQVLKGLRKAEQGTGIWSADLPVGEEGTSTFDLVLCSLLHEDLREMADSVIRSRRLRARINGSGNGDGKAGRKGPEPLSEPNREIAFASIATVVDPTRPACPVVIIRLAAVRDGARIVDEIVKPPQARSLPGPGQYLPSDRSKSPSQP